jgi:glutamate-5-semialdehyde dehydrogenase
MFTICPTLLGLRRRGSYNQRLYFLLIKQTMTESVLDYMTRLGRAARAASRLIAHASSGQKNRALLAAADALDDARAELAPLTPWTLPLAVPVVWSRRCWSA